MATNDVTGVIQGQSDGLVFYVNGTRVHDANPDPEVTLLTYLRTKLSLTGSKLGCGEGGCGACTVMISRWSRTTSKIINYAANACLLQAVSLHGHAVTTVEGIGSTKTKLHAVQERLSNMHGSQCGFCTPGMIMSMYALLRNKPLPQMKDIEETLQGNLCRCTGYRPIIKAFSTFANVDGGECAMGKKCCRFNKDESGNIQRKDGGRDQIQNSFTKYDPTQELIFPPQLLVESRDGKFDVPLMFIGERCTWFRPITIDHLLQLKSQFPESKFVSGNTEVGVEANLKGTSHSNLINVASIDELNVLQVSDEGVTIGASRPLNDVKDYMEMLMQDRTGHVNQSMKAVVDMLEWFAGTQIRNVAGIGGNLMTASPISDLNPIWMVCGTHVEVRQNDRVDIIPVDSKFFTGYRRTRLSENQVVVNIHLPFTKKNEYMRAYKISKRKEDDITIVNAAMRVVFDEGSSRIKNYFVAYGGMSATTIMPSNVMSNATGRDWKDTTLVDDMASWLQEDLPLSVDAPGGMPAYRETLATSLFLKFYIDIRTELYKTNILKDEVPRMELSAIEPLHNRWEDMKSTQTWQEVDRNQSSVDEVGRAKKHVAADLHVTGEAVYVDDIPLYKDELHLCMVTSTRAHAQIIHVNIDTASRHPGFVAFIDKNDVPGSNKCGIFKDDQVFADGNVTRVGQIIGAVVADTRAHAQQAAKLVQVTYKDLQPCIITIEDAIEHESYYDKMVVKQGDPEEEYGKCPIQIEAQLRIGAQEHFYLETQCCIALPKENNEMEIIASTQGPTDVQKEVAEVVGLAHHKVSVTVKRLGGGFGGKESNSLLVCNACAVAAHKLGRPIRCVLDRHEDMVITGTRHPYLGKYKIGATEGGEIVAVILDLYSNGGNNVDMSLGVMSKAMLNADNAYKMPNVKICGYVCRTNIASNTAFRGFGGPQVALITEDMLDRLAGRLDMDPSKVREMNLYHTGDTTYWNLKLNQCQLQRCYDECFNKSEYESRRKAVDQFNKENLHRKRGLSLNMMNFGISFELPHMTQAGALVHIYTDGSVMLTHGGTEMGQGLHTKMIQVAGRVLGIGTEEIYINETSTKTVPNTTPTAASSGSDLNGEAVKNACEKLMKRLEPYRKAEMSWKELISTAYVNRVNLSATGHYGHLITYSWDKKSGEIIGSPWLYCSYGCAVSEVEVDCLTGEHVILRTDIVLDVGKSLNPAVDIGQIEGAFMQGYGLYCLEEHLHSPQGSLLTRGPGSYKIPAFGQCPQQFNVHLLSESSNPKAIYHSKAIGEPPLLLANSVFFAIKDAIRAHRRDNDFSPDFQLNSPSTVERTRMAMGDRFAMLQNRSSPSSASKGNGVKPWSVQA